MVFQFLKVDRDEHILTCSFSNPPSHTLTAEAVDELAQFVESVQQDKTIRVVIFTSDNPGVFIAHYEVNELQNESHDRAAVLDEPEQMIGSGQFDGDRTLSAMNKLCLRLATIRPVTIAAINGTTLGGGFEFCLSCDFRLMSDGRFRVGLPETSIGIIPGAGGTQRYARLLGTAKAIDLIMHAKLLTPVEALDFGLIHRLFDPNDFQAKAQEFACSLAERSPLALAAVKKSIYQGAQLPLKEALFLEQNHFDEVLGSKDAREAMNAYLQGDVKSPVWTGE